MTSSCSLSIKSISTVAGDLLMASSCSLSIKSISTVAGDSFYFNSGNGLFLFSFY